MATIYRNRQLMYLSAVLFFYFASMGCLTPFLTSHMRHLGFSQTEISFVNAVSAFFSLTGPLLGGTFAERRNCYRSILIFCILAGSLAFMGLSFVPRYDKLNYRPLVDFDCDAGLRIERCVNWRTCGEAIAKAGNATAIKLSDCHYQCPKSGSFVPDYPLHICFHGSKGNICVVYNDISYNSSLTEFESQLQSWPYKEIAASRNATGTNFTEEEIPRAHVSMCSFLPTSPITFNNKEYQGISCRPTKEDCTINCRVSFSSEGNNIFPQQCEEAYGNPTTTFWSYLVLRSIGDLCLLTTVCLLDAVTIWSTIDYDGAYGRIHVWAALGMATTAPLSGALLDYYTDMDGRSDFSPPTYLSIAFAVFTVALIVVLPFHRQKAQFQQQVTPKETSFFSAEMIAFLLVLFVLGMQWSILFTFLPWLNADIGCSSVIMGFAITLMFGFSVPFLLISKNMVRNIGKANLLVFSFLFYFTYYAGVTFVTAPWWTLPFSLMGCFTLCVMWIASVAYGQALAPSGYSLIMQYLMNMLHFGLGRGIGSLIGGALLSSYTQRAAFCGIAVFSAMFAFFYLTFYHLGLRKPKKTYPALLSETWYPLQQRFPNGDAKSHQPIIANEEDDINSSPSSH